jgi:ribulose-5-phosphate 4-epimerase/fuculose-1-phosphate aldolase
VKSLGKRNHLILRNHGLLAVGPDIPTTFNRLWVLQRACEIQLASDAASGPNRSIPESILRTVPETRVAGKGEVHRVIFDTMLRRAGISF